MCQFGVKQYYFVFCLCISIMIFSANYFRTKLAEPRLLKPANCRNLSNQCNAFLSVTEIGQHRPCQVENYILSSGLRCTNLMRDLHFITRPLSQEEEDYPLAFILTVHKDLELLVRLLRAIYMPQNLYCIHVDAKAPMEYRAAVQRLVSCFKNVFLSSHSETVTYAGFSRLQADLNCMKDLAKSKVGWKKVVNLCGQDFPTKSNRELVRYMQSEKWKDRNMTPGVKQPASMRHRTQLQHIEIIGSHVTTKKGRKSPPPHNLEVYFGTAYYALTRAFVDFVLKSPIAQDLLVWSKDTFSPDEHYWVTLNHIKDAPGNYMDGGWEGDIRAIKWRDQEKIHNGCKGHYVRDICIYGIEDLSWIIDRNSMFANKFESSTYPEALDCLELWHRNKVLSQAAVPINPLWLFAPWKKSRDSNSSYFNRSAEA